MNHKYANQATNFSSLLDYFRDAVSGEPSGFTWLENAQARYRKETAAVGWPAQQLRSPKAEATSGMANVSVVLNCISNSLRAYIFVLFQTRLQIVARFSLAQ
ncbi:MAG: hypothetical protein INF97_17955 [Roseomonas sp.]|nr:hypothetical protein [Roseomonas sp.]